MIVERKLMKRTGTEGPMHDPYSFTERIVVLNNKVITLHTGLLDFLRVEGEKIVSGSYEKSIEKFKDMTGMDEDVFDKAYYRINTVTKCPHCHSRSFEWVSGFPGETIQICGKCHIPVGTEQVVM